MKPKTAKIIKLSDSRVKAAKQREEELHPKKKKKTLTSQSAKPAISSTTMFFSFNQQLGPPFLILCDTNFINFSIKNKLDIVENLMDCLLAKCVPYVTDCVVAELQKLGSKYRVALKIVKQCCERLPCDHKGTYADDCIVNRVTQHKCYIVGTCDKELKRRIRKIPGVPIISIVQRQYSIERMPDAYGCNR
ncbi:rRNA-processing protein FCF1-like protein [Dinothrombium tinctorium]|uniref:rRNA-processing protein FCF1-like protein n=1 Tax=Dinothrombium tinctorium TaxID=1965070 RepID=A0A3S3QIX6_9ACAR|nr:rRNA-processing protein FCF1-like protein [Dinothrombium tinctorium]RWS11007.1 rRNA-processing protein FCF1-like protein [Dinothrombium tinctorium]